MFVRTSRLTAWYLLLLICMLLHACSGRKSRISPHLEWIQGDINGAFIRSGTKRLVFYGDPAGVLSKAEMVLFTHARRDVVWAGRDLVREGAEAVVPRGEAAFFTRVDSCWNDFRESRYHDYSQQSTKWLSSPLVASRRVGGGDTIQWHGIPIRVIDSRGYTRGAVSYLVRIDGLDVAFTGDLIYGDGKIMDLYSTQDQIREVKVRGYHGYASRIADLISSLERLASLDPDLLVPVHGPVIEEPGEAIGKLIGRLRQLYSNYLSVNAFRWYTGQEIQEFMAGRVLPAGMPVDWMPYAETSENPSWLIHRGNSKLILSQDGKGFLIDCGMEQVFHEMMRVEENFPCHDIDGMFITHYHDDHTDYVNEIREKYHCPVYVTPELEDILEHPRAYRLPAMTSSPIDSLVTVPDASGMTWKEFTFTFYYFPGQTLYHDALLVEKKDGEKIFFVGDSFSPTGLDDYCLQNRNFVQSGMGYLYCLQLLRNLPGDCWIVNNHIEPPFRFTAKQLDFMAARLHERRTLLQDLFPWDEPNYGLDERWARMYPYGQTIRPGQQAGISVVIFNHSEHPNEYLVRPLAGLEGLSVSPEQRLILIPPNEEGRAAFILKAGKDTPPGLRVQTVDIAFDGWTFHEWCESMIEVKSPT
jgi:glyoxylase-like metal-dependent hydrolase (beta-lactamase superfamily II)